MGCLSQAHGAVVVPELGHLEEQAAVRLECLHHGREGDGRDLRRELGVDRLVACLLCWVG